MFWDSTVLKFISFLPVRLFDQGRNGQIEYFPLIYIILLIYSTVCVYLRSAQFKSESKNIV